jgi:hypothetical protein
MATVKWVGGTDGDWSDGTNWDTGSAPVTGDDVIIPRGAEVNITEGLAQSAVDLKSLTIEEGCSISIGTATSPLQIGRGAGGNITWGGTGTTYMQVAGDLSGGTFTARGAGTLYLASYSTEETIDTLNISGSGTIYLAWKSDERAMIDTIRMSGTGSLYIGDGVTAATVPTDFAFLSAASGAVYAHSTLESCTVRGGTVTIYGSVRDALTVYAGTVYFNTGGVTVTGITMYGGTLYYNDDDTITTATLYDGTIDFSANVYGCTVETVNIYGSATFNDPNNAVAVGTVFNFYGTDASTATVNFGQHRKITTADIA